MVKLINALAAGLILCGLAFGFVVGSRIDQSTITLLSGTLVGIVVATPCAAIITWLVMLRKNAGRVNHDEWRAHERMMQAPSPQSLPPVYAFPPTYPQPQSYLPGQEVMSQLPPPRTYYVYGEDGHVTEVKSDERLGY